MQGRLRIIRCRRCHRRRRSCSRLMRRLSLSLHPFPGFLGLCLMST